MNAKEGPDQGPKMAESQRSDNASAHINSFMSSEEIRELLSQEHSIQSIEQLQDNWDRIPRAFRADVIDYLSDAQREYGKNSSFGKKIENFLTSISSPGSEIIKKINAAIRPKGKVKRDAQRLKNAVNLNENNAEGQKIDTGETVYFKNFKRVHVAQGFTDDTMYIAVPLWYDRPIIDKKTGDLLYTKRELGNFVILSSHKIIRPSDSYFREREIVAEFPETVLDERWSMDSIREFQDPKVSVDPTTVFAKLNEIWKKYMDLSGNPGTYTALPLINTLSYCLWLFQYAPYLKYEGGKGSSKSKACEIHEYIDFNAFSGVDYTPAVIFRTLQDTRGTLIIDEAETYDKLKNKSEYEQAREAIINAGFKANGKVSRMERTENRFNRVDYHVFGIKIIGSIHGVSETIRDRAYQIMLTKTLNKEISKRIPRPNSPEFQEIRDMLYVMALTYWKEIQDIEQNEEIENRLDLIGREWDKAKPLLVLATFYARHDPKHGKEILDDLWQFLSDQKNREIALTIDTFDEVVIGQVEYAIRDEAKKDKLTEIDDRNFDLHLTDVSLAIATLEAKKESRNFNLRNYSRSIKNKIQKLAIGNNFRHGTDNVTIFTSNLKLIRDARKRYSISPSGEEKQDAFNSINFINLINSINSFNSQLKLIEINRNSGSKNSINSSLTKENTDSLMRGINQLIELIAGTSTPKHSKITEDAEISPVQNENSLWKSNPKKALFELVESEAPKAEYHSLKPKVIYDMIAMDGVDLPTVYSLCEQLHKEGAFVKNKAGAYSVNKEFLEGGDYK